VSTRLQRLLQFVEQDSANLTLRKDAIREACDAGDWQAAHGLVDVGLQAQPLEPELLALSGLICLQTQRYPQAVHALSGAIAGGLDDVVVRYNLAFAYFMATRYDDALVLLTDAVVAQVPPMACLLRARCLHHLNRPLEAIVDCNACLEQLPGDTEAGGLLALLLYDQGRTEDARARVDTVLSKDALQREALLARASLLADSGDYHAAHGAYDTLLQAHPLCGPGWFGLAMLELRQLHKDAAYRYIRLAVARMPEHIGCWHGLAWIEILRGEIAAAQVAFQRALLLDRNLGETHGGLAVVDAMQGREPQARDNIKRAMRLNPSSMSARYAELLLLERAGKHAEARAAFDRVLAMPVPHSDLQYRDLVRLHVSIAQLNAAESPAAGLH
jgi:tetratricopeptide (TPR) repeat protein